MKKDTKKEVETKAAVEVKNKVFNFTGLDKIVEAPSKEEALKKIGSKK